MKTTANKLTYRDYLCFPNDGMRHEIIGGDHYMNAAPSTYHQFVSRRVQFLLYTQIERQGLGNVIYAPVDVQLTESDIVQPDLVIVLTDNKIITPTKVKGSPDHIIEILSPSTQDNDRGLKFNLYERVGIPEYWILDPHEHELLQFVLTDGKYHEKSHGGIIATSYLPEVTVDLKEVW